MKINPTSPRRGFLKNTTSTSQASEGITHPSETFLDLMFEQVETDRENICVTRQGVSGAWFNCLPTNPQFQNWQQGHKEEAWYYALCTVDGEPNDSGKMLVRTPEQ